MNFLLLVTDDFILPRVCALNKTGHLLATKERSGARKAGENTSRRVCTERLRVRCISVHFGSCFATVQNRLVPRMACHPIKRKLDVTKTQIHRGFSVCKPFAADCMDTFHKYDAALAKARPANLVVCIAFAKLVWLDSF